MATLLGLLSLAGSADAQNITGAEEWIHTHRGTDIGRAGFELANLDGGGFPDLVATAGMDDGFDENRYWYVMNGRTFDVLATGAYYDRLDILEVMDTDGDGLDDILVGADDRVEIWRWNTVWGRLDLEQSIDIAGPTQILGIHWADLDLDGNAEILVTDEFTLWIYDADSSSLESTVVGYGRGAVTTGQLDADPQLEIVGGGDPWGNPGFVLDGSTLALQWEGYDQFGRRVSTVDLTGDGFEEIVGIGGIYPARVLDPTTQSDLWFNGWWQSDAGRLVDLDEDGQLELVLSDPNDNLIQVLDAATGVLEDTIYLSEHHATGLVAGDLHSNPGLELAWADTLSNGTVDWLRLYDVANDVVLLQTEELRGPSGFATGLIDTSGSPRLVETVRYAEGGGRHQIFDLDGSLVSAGPPPPGNGALTVAAAIADVLGDGREEIVAGPGLTTYTTLQAFDESSNELWPSPDNTVPGLPYALEIVDLDGNGSLEVVSLADQLDFFTNLGSLGVADAADGQTIWSDVDFSVSGHMAHLRVADVDGDGHLEILGAEEEGGLRIWDAQLQSLEQHFTGLSITGLDTPDRDGDGTAEILIATATGEIQRIDVGTGAAVETVADYASPVRGLQVLDVDGDGFEDYVYVQDQRLKVFSGGTLTEVFVGDDMGLDEAGALDGVRAGDFDSDGHLEVWIDRGFSGTRMVELRVAVGEVPTVTFREPGDWEPTYCYLLPYGCQVYAEAEALDFEDYQIYEGWWISSLEGVLDDSYGNPQTYYLGYLDLNVLGTHEISFHVVDMDGNPASGSVTYEVYEENLGAPVVTINSPEDGAVIYESQSVQFDATAIDPEAGDVSHRLNWYVQPSNTLLWEGGGSFSTYLPVGTTSIDASVYDWDLDGIDSVNVTVLPDPPPEVTLSSPADGTSVVVGTSLDFVGDAQDLEDGDLSAGLDWQSDLQGGFGTGASFSTSSLIVGTHTITASATDSRSQIGSDSISVTITPNTVPVVSITAPADGSDFTETDPIGFVATATDTEDGDLTASLAWSSDLDGALGTGGSLDVSTLSVGAHVVTATVTDSHGDPGSDSIQVVVDVNEAPVVTITAPAPAQTFTETDPVAFAATATDAEDGDLTASLDWSSDLDGALGSGGSLDLSTLSVGTHVVTASVTDSYGEPDSDSVTVTIAANEAPTVSIIEPPGSVTVTETDPVLLEATASDAEDGDLTAGLDWSSDLDGALGSGGSISVSTLSVGAHVVTAAVTDGHGDSGSDSVTVIVEANNAPTVSITAPANGSSSTETDPVAFAATASDVEDGSLTTGLTWTSSLDGSIGSGGAFSLTSLSVGTHVITAAVTDSHGDPGSDTVTITIDANNAPTVLVTAPANGSTFTEGDLVNFTGSASDAEDGDLSASLNWTSSIDGGLGGGASLGVSTLSVGNHLITSAVTDSHGAPGQAQINVQVIPAPVQLVLTSIAGEDGWTLEKRENGEFGDSADSGGSGSQALRVGDDSKDKQYRSVVSFDTSAIPAGAQILSAQLRVRRATVVGSNPYGTLGNLVADVKTGGFGGSTSLAASDFEAGADVTSSTTLSNPVADLDWAEGSLDATGLAALDVGGTTQFRLAFQVDDDDDRNDDFLGFFSGEAATGDQPELVILYQP